MSKKVQSFFDQPEEERKNNYIKHKNGAVFLIRENYKKPEWCYLVSIYNRYHSHKQHSLKQGIVSGLWSLINVHEMKKYEKSFKENAEKTTIILLRQVIFSELLISANTDVMNLKLQDTYFNNLLQKCSKQAERISDKHFDNLYKSDPVMLTNIMEKIENLVKNIANLQPHEIVVFENFTQQFFENPKKFKDLFKEVTFKIPN